VKRAPAAVEHAHPFLLQIRESHSAPPLKRSKASPWAEFSWTASQEALIIRCLRGAVKRPLRILPSGHRINGDYVTPLEFVGGF